MTSIPPTLALVDAARELRLGFDGFASPDLHTPDGLARLYAVFEGFLEAHDAPGLDLLRAARTDPDALSRSEHSALVLRISPVVGAFLARLFRVEAELAAASARVLADEPVFHFRKQFVKKRLLKPAPLLSGEPLERARRVASLAWAAVREATDDAAPVDEERAVAIATLRLDELGDVARKISRAGGASWTAEHRARLSALRTSLRAAPDLEALAEEDDEGLTAAVLCAVEAVLRSRREASGDPARHWTSLRPVHKQDFAKLVPLRRASVSPESRAALEGELVGDVQRRSRAEPFALTDERGTRREVEAQIDACLFCHEREKDSCSGGLKDKAGALKKNPLGVELGGCPLDEKISEAQLLRRNGDLIGALVAVALDNPMCPGTGHRICNDCMKSCIFQAQEPVNVPQVETGVLDDVLSLPWGFEIWSLLTRFHPLSLRRPTPRPHHGKTALVVGLGPAGYTLAHYLVNEGFGVVAIDGLKIEPLPVSLTGLDGRVPRPVRDVNELREPLASRTVLGFGGVSEYGITVRWDKSFLTMLYLNLARRNTFRAYGGVRFGGTLTLEDAWALSFDHVAVAAGAGRPTLVRMKNGLSRGVRQASDFLMALQLSGAFRRESLANLQVRLPVIVIGSGLTAIDTATEALAYYVVQAEKNVVRYDALRAEHGEASVRARFDAEELATLDESLAHGRALLEARRQAERVGLEPDFASLLDSWGGARVVYRRRLVDSPAYRLNHEEVVKSLEEGVRYVELLSPTEVHLDAYGATEAVTFERTSLDDGGALVATGEHVRLEARSVFVAAGTKPNVTYERELPGTFELDAGGYFAPHTAVVEDGETRLEPCAGGNDGFFTSYLGPQGQTVSFYGDNHPRYAGSVVKAMASAKDGHPAVVSLFGDALDVADDGALARWDALVARMDDELCATVHEVRRLAPSIVDVVVRAPRAARRFEPGQFFRLQSFERHSPRVDGTPLVMEGLALTGAATDPERGLLSLIVLEMGASSRLCAQLRPGDPVVVMGPTGRPSEIASGENVLLLGGGLGNAVLFSIARAFRAAGSRVLYFAGYRRSDMLFKREEIEAATDQVIWATDEGAGIVPQRPQDRHFRGNIVDAVVAFGRGDLGPRAVELPAIDRILAIGSDGMMNAVARARHGVLREFLSPDHVAIGSINSPMQCMMKEVCAQCLQRHVDPITGEERIVYSCFDQDQPLDQVDFAHLRQRLRQSSVQEKLSDMWLTRLTRELRAAD